MDFKSLASNQKFRLNVLIPSLYLLPLVVAYFSEKNSGFGFHFLVLPAILIAAGGCALWILAMVHLGKSLAVLPGSNRLVVSGIYQYLRHPIYVGITLTLFGFIVACGSTFGLVYLFVVVLPLNFIRARLEEKELIEQYGARYRDYMKSSWF